LPYAINLANKGLQALRDDEHLRNGLNVHAGHITFDAVAQALGEPCLPAEKALNSFMQSA